MVHFKVPVKTRSYPREVAVMIQAGTTLWPFSYLSIPRLLLPERQQKQQNENHRGGSRTVKSLNHLKKHLFFTMMLHCD
jgi:hypothetical protein